MAKAYQILKPLVHNRKNYEPGDIITSLGADEVDRLIRLKVITQEPSPVTRQSGGSAGKSETPAEKPLEKMNRDELNAKALEVGIESPEELADKNAVIQAIKQKAESSGDDPDAGNGDDATGDGDGKVKIPPGLNPQLAGNGKGE